MALSPTQTTVLVISGLVGGLDTIKDKSQVFIQPVIGSRRE
jgi:predicted dinucleotide-utilizing enzyme